MIENNFIIFDIVKNIKQNGEFSGSIISKTIDPINTIIFSDNIIISDEDRICISDGLMVGFEDIYNESVAFSRKSDYTWDNMENSTLEKYTLEYSLLIPDEIMQLYDEGQFSDAFPFTINLLHTAGLFLNDYKFKIDHLKFFKGEILKNPVSLIINGLCVADRVVIDYRGDPVFYDCLVIGRDENDDLNVSYETLLNVKIDDNILKYIIILGIEELKI